MDKKETKHLKEERTCPEKEPSCNCGPDCKCGCQEGGECHCAEDCGCGCLCKKKAAKLLAIILIFTLGFCSAKITGNRPPAKHMPFPPKAEMRAPTPTIPHYTEGTGNTIIIINTDGGADVSRFLGSPSKKDCNCKNDRNFRKPHHDKRNKPHNVSDNASLHFDNVFAQNKATAENALKEKALKEKALQEKIIMEKIMHENTPHHAPAQPEK